MKKKLHIRVKITQFMITLTTFLVMALQGFSQNVNRSYTESFEDFMNPDRGFYYPYDSEDWYEAAGVYKALNENTLRNRRTAPFLPEEQWDPQGTIDAAYNVKTSIILRHFVLDDFTTSDISPAFLNKIQADFDKARNAGVRMVLRFSYAVTPNAGNCAAGFNCPPYGDASRFWVERHIDQLTDYLRNNEDVIMVVQQGFIGTWGEQYYTDHFGDASGQTDGQTYLDADNWNDRIAVLKKLLDAVPECRMVQVRYPQMKIKFLQRYPTYANRIGFQNDCFLSSHTDVGTFVGYDQNDPSTLSELRNYANNNGDFVAVGGETCGDSNSAAASYAYNNCESNGGSAITEMQLMNYSFINSAYSYIVNNDWATGNCIDEIKRRLGYRFVLKNGQYPPVAQKGTTVNFTLNLDNVGFAAPFNERKLFMLLKNGSTYLNPIEVYGDGSDIRTWRSGSHNLNLRFDLPANINVGDYEMYLHIADLSKQNRISESVRNNPVYCIRFANNGLWDANTGYNKLNHTISIQNTEPPIPPTGNNCVEIDGNFTDWQNIVRLSAANNGELSTMKVADDDQYIYIHLTGTLRNHYQIFLDTDGNKSVSNYNDQEYVTSNWPETGFNYMIENGSLVRHFSNNPWSWPFISTIQQRESGGGLELIVPKNLLAGLSNSYINVAANTLDASWTGTAYLPASGNLGANYQLFSSNPCNEPDVCVLIDGDSNDWQSLGSTYSNNAASLKTLKVTDNTQDLFVLFEGSLSNFNHTPQIFFDTDNNTMGNNEFRETDWDNTGFNYMMEFNTLYKYIGSGTSWEWQPLGQITIKGSNGGNNTLEMKIPKSKFNGSLGATIKVAGYYYNGDWAAAGVLPANSNNGVNYTLSNSSTCGAVVQKTKNENETILSKTKYNLEASTIVKETNYNSFNKKISNNCISIDGNHNEWNAMNTYGYAATGSLTHVKVADNSNEILFYLEGGLDVNNQIFINSDVNNTVLNRYTGSQWEYAGFNYLIENSELFVYNGDGTTFVWSPVGTVNYSSSANVLEVSVQKSQLSNLSSSISFAATSLNADYHETGAVPNSNSALNYLTGTKDLCSIKPSCFNINGNMEQWLNINGAAQLANNNHLQSIKISDGSESLYILLEGKMDVYQQIFIDTDNDAIGNNEYTDSNWSETGFNYLIDEGDLFIYQGDGITWDWLPLGAVNMISSAYITEVSIKKYLLGNIATTVNIAASSFDENWAETSFIPASEQATSYVPSSNTLSLFFHQNGINFHQAYNVIESSANLTNSATNEVYKAGQSIQLNNGFSSPPLTNFSAYIEACE